MPQTNVIMEFFADSDIGYRAIVERVDFNSSANPAMIMVDDQLPEVIVKHEYAQFLEHIETAIITSMAGWYQHVGNNNT